MHNIALLYGGASSERDVSLSSGKAIYQGLIDVGHDVKEFILTESEVYAIIDELKTFDIVFLGFHGGFGEDGHVQALLEMAKIPFTGSDSLCSFVSMDKELSKIIVHENNVPIAKSICVTSNELTTEIKAVIENLGLPLAVKPASGGSTIGFTKVERFDQIEDALDLAFKYDKKIMIEQFIEGIELTVSFLEKRILPPVMIKPENGLYDYEHKYTKGTTNYLCPAPIDQNKIDEMSHYARLSINALKCRNYGRIDFRMDGAGNLVFLEANTLPGMTDLSLVPMAAKAVGINFTQLLDNIVNDAFHYFK